MALTVSGIAEMLSAQSKIGDGRDSGSIRKTQEDQSEEKKNPYAAVLERAAEGGTEFRKDIDAIVQEIEKIGTGESQDRDELRKLLDLTASKSREGAYGAYPPRGVFFPALFA